eukprot:6471456-Amphidinium_carterae.1
MVCMDTRSGDKYMKRVIFTKKKMGAQTIEANSTCGFVANTAEHQTSTQHGEIQSCERLLTK